MNIKLVVASFAVVLGLGACSQDIDVIAGDVTESIALSAELTSSSSLLGTVNTGDSTVYGWNLLEGTATNDGDPVEVQMLGNVDYVDGNGDFFGFITFTLADGSTIGVRMVGEATAASDTSNATFVSSLSVVGGTGTYLDVSGTGTFTGERQDALGGVVSSRFTLDLIPASAG